MSPAPTRRKAHRWSRLHCAACGAMRFEVQIGEGSRVMHLRPRAQRREGAVVYSYRPQWAEPACKMPAWLRATRARPTLKDVSLAVFRGTGVVFKPRSVRARRSS